MVYGKVIGSLVSTIKLSCYKSKKLMLVRPVGIDGELKKGTIVAVDTVGAGKGDYVLVAAEGKAASEILGFRHPVPVRSVILAIVDKIDVNPG